MVGGGGGRVLGGGEVVRRACFASNQFSSSVSKMVFVYVSIRSTSSVSWWVVNSPLSGSAEGVPNQASNVFAVPHVK